MAVNSKIQRLWAICISLVVLLQAITIWKIVALLDVIEKILAIRP